jgi:uncharacterized protein YraI
MKGFLFLSLVGAGIYGALLISNDLLLSNRAEKPSFAHSLGDRGERQLRSWGSDLPALTTSSPQAVPMPLREPAASSQATETSQTSTPVERGLAVSKTRTSVELAGAEYIPTESAKVSMAARVHSGPSVSSPIIRFYPRGTALQVIDRENGWVQVTDPSSGESGWVLDQYLIAIEGRSVTQTALETTASKALAEPMQTKSLPRTKKRGRTPGVWSSKSVALARLDRRWERRTERRGGFGLFFFGRFARAE